MNLTRSRTTGVISRIELLLVVAILAVIAAPIGRVVFAREFRAFDEALFRRLGVDPELGRFVGTSVVLAIWASLAGYAVWRRRRQASIAKQPFVRLPIHKEGPKA